MEKYSLPRYKTENNEKKAVSRASGTGFKLSEIHLLYLLYLAFCTKLQEGIGKKLVFCKQDLGKLNIFFNSITIRSTKILYKTG